MKIIKIKSFVVVFIGALLLAGCKSPTAPGSGGDGPAGDPTAPVELKSFTVEPEVVRLGGSARYTAMTYCPTGRMIEVAFVTKRGETVVDAPKYSRVSNCSGGVVSSNNGGYVFSNSLESLGEYTVTVTVYDQNAGVTVSDTKPLTVIP